MHHIVDPVALRHPKNPGVVIVKSRRQLPALERAGWVEAKSPEAKAAVEATRPPEDANPSKED